MRAGMKRSITRQGDVRGGEQHRELVLVEIVLVAVLIAVVQQVPAVDFLDQRQMLRANESDLPR